MSKGLTPKQQAFVDEYLIDLNATKAAIRAGYSEKTAGWIGPELLGKTHIAEAIAWRMAERSRRTQIDADWLLRRLAMLADADIADLYDDAGMLKPAKNWPEAWRKGLVAGVETLEEFERDESGAKQLTGYTKKLKLADRLKNLELIGRHVGVGAFRDQVAVTGKDGGPVQTEAVVKFYIPENGR